MKYSILGTALGLWTILATPAFGAEPEAVDLIVAGRHVVTMDEALGVIDDGAIAIRNGVIIAVGPRREIEADYTAPETVSGDERAVLPGLVNGHGHAAMTLFRGMADDLDLNNWLFNFIFPMEGQFVDADFVRVGTELACWEMIRGGTTTFVDMYFYPDTIAEVVDDCGLRAILGAPSIDFPSPGFKGWDDSFAEGIAYAKRWKDKNSRITPAFAVHAPYTVTPEHYAQALAVAKELGVPITTHLAEARSEREQVSERYGTTSVKLMHGLGLLDYPLIAAHMIWPDEDEIKLLAASPTTGAIHNPTSNLKTAAGISPVPQMLAAGVKIGIGTDGAASNNDLDMWEELRLAALIHKGVSGDPTVLPAGTILSMATAGGADAIGLGETIGALRPGMRADLIQVSLEGANMTPLYDITSHLVYATNSRDVVTTIVDGHVLMKDRKILTLDVNRIRAEAREKAEAVAAVLKKN